MRKLAVPAILTMVVGVLAVGSPATGHTPGTVIVDGSDTQPDSPDCGSAANPCNTIQTGVDHAAPGETVEVRSETYQEQVVINKDLDLVGTGNPDPEIVAPSSPEAFTFPESGSSWEPVVFAFGGSESNGDVSGSGTVNVDIEGFTIDGDDRNPGDRSAGILYRNASGSIDDNVVQNMHVGGKETFGILVYGDSDVTISGNDVSEYSRTGIGVTGDDASQPDPTGTIADNLVVGPGTRPEGEWAPNGIQLSFGAAGSIIENEVRDNGTETGFASSGIIVFDAADGAQVTGNELRRNELSIAFFVADDGDITKNTIRKQVLDSDGIRVAASDGAFVHKNDVQGAGDDGIQLGFGSSGGTVSKNRTVQAADDGFFARDSTSGNTFEENEALGSGDLACNDTSSDGGTAGTANTWTGNKGTSPSNPAGLCPRGGKPGKSS